MFFNIEGTMAVGLQISDFLGAKNSHLFGPVNKMLLKNEKEEQLKEDNCL